MVFHLGLLDLIYLGPCQPGGCSEPVVHSATHSDRLGQMTTCSVLSRERGRCLDAMSPGDLCGQSSQQFMLCSQPVPLLSWDSPWDSEAMTPPFTDGMCVCVCQEGDHLAPSQPGWSPTPCFVRRVWNVLGHRALLPGGDAGAIALISLLDRFSPSFQLGTRQAPSSQLLPGPARLCLSWLWQPQACSWEPRASQGRLL